MIESKPKTIDALGKPHLSRGSNPVKHMVSDKKRIQQNQLCIAVCGTIAEQAMLAGHLATLNIVANCMDKDCL